MINLSAAMTDLVQRLRTTGFLDLKWPEIKPQCDDDWTADYAVAKHAYVDDFMLGEFFEVNE